MNSEDYNKYIQNIYEMFEGEVNNFKENLFNKISNEMNKFKNDILESSFIMFKNISKHEILNESLYKNDIASEKIHPEIKKSFTNKIIKIKVGEKIFQTKINNFLKYPQSKLYQALNVENNFEINKEYLDDEGFIFFDRNPKYFEFVLDSIRNGIFIPTGDETLNKYIEYELKFFNVEFLLNKTNELDGKSLNLQENETKEEGNTIESLSITGNISKCSKKHEESTKIENPESIEERNNDIICKNFREHKIRYTNTPIKCFEFDTNYKNSNLKLSEENLTVENIIGWGDASVLGNYKMEERKFEWLIFIDKLAYDMWITFGVADKSEISNSMKDEHINSWSISSTNESWRMQKPKINLKENNHYLCYLDFEKDLFQITGNGIDCKNEISVKDRELYILINLYNSKNKISIKNFRILEN